MKKSVYLSGLLVICFSLFTIAAKAQVPVVTTDPVNQTVCASDTAYFHIEATGATPLTFMWEFSTDGGTSWDTVFNDAVYAGATNDTLRVIPSASLHLTDYRCLVFNGAGSDTSNSATLTVETMLMPGTITGPSAVCSGFTVLLTAPIPGGVWSVVDPTIDTVYPSGLVEGRSFGTDTVKYTLTNSCGTSMTWKLMDVQNSASPLPITGPTHVCDIGFISLANANTAGTWTWSDTYGHVSVSTSGVVSGVSAGADVVTYAFTNACNTVYSWKNITVETLPTAGTISGPSALCHGTWVNLTSSVSGGVWLSGTTSVAVVNSVGAVTGISQGTSIISYYLANSCGSVFGSHTITVEVPAAAITGNDSVGIDSTLNLFNTTPGGVWTSADASIATIGTSGVVTGVDTGVTTITYSVTNTCGSSATTIPMNVGPLPDAGTLTGADSVCVGATVTLTPSVTGGTWISKHDTLATVDVNTGVITGVKYGKDTIIYTVTTAFGSRKISKSLFVNQPPQIYINGPSSVALSGGYQLLAFPHGGSWTTNNPAMAPITATITGTDSVGTTNAKTKSICFFVVLDGGTTIFNYVNTNTCGTRSKTFTITLPLVNSITDVAENGAKMNIYPNPARTALTVNIASPATEKVKVTLMNMLGEKVQEFEVMTNSPSDVALDLPGGMYLLNATTADGNTHTARLSVTN